VQLSKPDKLARVTGLEKEFACEAVDAEKRDIELVNFIRCPLIEGQNNRGTKAR
jgi:hypothetical protein